MYMCTTCAPRNYKHVWYVIICVVLMHADCACFWSYTASSGKDRVLVPSLECGESYSYTIPSFSVITMQMRRANISQAQEMKKLPTLQMDLFEKIYP